MGDKGQEVLDLSDEAWSEAYKTYARGLKAAPIETVREACITHTKHVVHLLDWIHSPGKQVPRPLAKRSFLQLYLFFNTLRYVFDKRLGSGSVIFQGFEINYDELRPLLTKAEHRAS